MKRLSKKLFVLVVLLFVTIGATKSEIFASCSYPSVSTNAYLEVTAFKNINVYTSSSLSTRGTASPKKKYNASISKGDAVYVYKITSNYCYFSYPVGTTRKLAYCKTSELLGSSQAQDSFKAQNGCTVYKYSTGTSYGSVSKKDTIYTSVKSNNKYFIIYTAKSGKRAWKAGWIKSSDLNKIKPEAAPAEDTSSVISNAETAAVQERLDSIAKGTLKYNSKTVLKVGSKFVGTRANEQCKGYAKNVFYLLFKVTPSSTKKAPSNYLLNSTKGMTRVGYVKSMSKERIKNLFLKARPGDFVQIRRSHGGSHSAIVYSVTNKGVTFLEANLDGKNKISKNYYTWSKLCSSNAAMSVYTASKYVLK